MRKSMEIVLPEDAVPLSMEEMRSVEGGSAHVGLTRSFLDKNFCLSQAGMLINQKKVVGMTKLEIAQELYAHAVVKYNYEVVLAYGVITAGAGLAVANEIYKSAANGADIEDYGDTAVRKTFYTTVWNVL